MNNCFKRGLRLTEKAQFNRVFNKARRIQTKFCVLYYCPNNLKYSRLGVIVAKRNIKNAVNRNLFKRCAREYFRINNHRLVGMDFVIVAYKQTTNVQKKELFKCLVLIWEKLVSYLEKQ